MLDTHMAACEIAQTTNLVRKGQSATNCTSLICMTAWDRKFFTIDFAIDNTKKSSKLVHNLSQLCSAIALKTGGLPLGTFRMCQKGKEI
jgi:hypothetical protein